MNRFSKNCWEVLQLLLAFVALEPKLAVNLCPESFVCKCRSFIEQVGIFCDGIDSLSDAQILLKRFQNKTVYWLYLNHCTIEAIPSKAFENSTILTMTINCPLQNVSDEAFQDVQGLEHISMKYTNFTQVPKGMDCNRGIIHLYLRCGALKMVGNDLINMTHLVTLWLNNNKISSISEEAFITLVNLTWLDLSCNMLTVLSPNILDTLKNLQFMDFSRNRLSSIDGLLKNINPKKINIHGNNISSIDNAFPQTLSKVVEIYIGENPLSFTSETLALCCENLMILDMHEINFTNPDPDFRLRFLQLQQLNLDNNKMSNISPQLFFLLIFLVKLRLGNNGLKSIDGLFEAVTSLNELYLPNNDIELLGHGLHPLLELKILDLSHNKIRCILNSDFYKLYNLKRLDLSYNKILWMSSGSFFDASNLEMLDLTSNNISSINGSVRHLPYLTEMFLSHNKIQAINNSELVGLPNLKNCSLFHNQIHSLDGAFKSLPSLISVLLDDNKLETLSEDTFANVSILRQVSLQDNQWSCDCRLIWLRNWLSKVNSTVHDDTPKCHLPKRFQNIPLTNLTVDDLIEWSEDCPESCRCECVAEGRNFFVSVNCSRRGLSEVPLFFPDHTSELYLNGNQLRNIDSFVNLSLNSLTLLNVGGNVIDTFPAFLPKMLRVLLMAENNITRFNVTTVANLSLQEATMSKNPWICDCQTWEFKYWLLSQSTVVTDVNATLCGPKQENSDLSNKAIIELTDEELCPSGSHFFINYIEVGLCLLVVVTSLGLVYIRFQMRIKVWMYAHGFSFVKEEDLDKNKEFDAFVSYSSHDADFYTAFKTELQKRQPQMCLCSSENFMYGSLIIENITKAVKASKRTILILSGNFLKSEWCKVEFKAAHQQALDDKIHRLIIMKYGEIPPDCAVDPALQEYLDTTTYLNWGEKYFWDKIIYALPKKKKKREKGIIGSVNASERTPLLTG